MSHLYVDISHLKMSCIVYDVLLVEKKLIIQMINDCRLLP